MALTGKQLADGQLAAAKATLYTTPAGTTTYVKSIICHNTHAANTNVAVLYVQPSGGTSRIIAKVALTPLDTLYVDDAIVLDTGDLIRGSATNATEVDYAVFGAEETV